MGPVTLCGRHFTLTLRAGDRLVSMGSAFDAQHVVNDPAGRTLRFSDEAFAVDQRASWRVSWRGGLTARRNAGSTGLPYALGETSGRYVLPWIDGTMLRGDARDAAALERLAVRTPASRCDRAIDLGTIGYSDDTDLSTMATR